MESAVLPQHAANPKHIRLDGKRTGPNGKVTFRFRHYGKVWKINFDTDYAPLEEAYKHVLKDETCDRFVEEPTEKRNGESKGTRLKLEQGSTNMFIYLTKPR